MLENIGRTVTLSRWVEFSSAHLYKQNKWSAQKNHDEFGACFTEHGHGHNYRLEVFLEGVIEAESGIVINLLDTDQYLKKLVAPFDHHHINFDIPEFKDLVPTTENIALYLWRKIKRDWSNEKFVLKMLRLQESDDLWVEIAK